MKKAVAGHMHAPDLGFKSHSFTQDEIGEAYKLLEEHQEAFLSDTPYGQKLRQSVIN